MVGATGLLRTLLGHGRQSLMEGLTERCHGFRATLDVRSDSEQQLLPQPFFCWKKDTCTLGRSE